MIHLERSGVAPLYLQSEQVAHLRETVQEFFTRKEQSRRQDRPDFPMFPQDMFTQLLDDLLRLTHGKCAYCESPIKYPGSATLDRYRPKAGAVGLSGDFSTEHYWWLAYTWENLFPACSKCNKFKGAKFPVSGSRARSGATLDELAAESRLLLDPFTDDPAKHLDFQDDGTVRPISSEGDVSIATFELNRSDLVSARRHVAQDVRTLLKEVRLPANIVEEGVGWLTQFLTGGAVKAPRPTELRRLIQSVGAPARWSAAAQAVVRRWSIESASKMRATSCCGIRSTGFMATNARTVNPSSARRNPLQWSTIGRRGR
jgi:uncharacterized protein (TIGR02646 family)